MASAPFSNIGNTSLPRFLVLTYATSICKELTKATDYISTHSSTTLTNMQQNKNLKS